MSARSASAEVVAICSPLAAVMWPHRAGGFSVVLRLAILIALGAALLTLAAKINLPLPYVPMTLQTLAVLVIGTVYGWRLGCATVVAYLIIGAIGLPVFVGPAGGLAPFMGPTAAYLVGFLAAAFATGWLSGRGWDRSGPLLFAAMGLGHLIILEFRQPGVSSNAADKSPAACATLLTPSNQLFLAVRIGKPVREAAMGPFVGE